MRVCSTKATMVGCPIDTRAVLAHLMVGQPSCPVPGLFEAGPCVEKALHRRLSSHRLRGEWFSPHVEVLAEIDTFKRTGK